MPQIKLTGGFYEAKSLIADAQKCINLYPEQNPPDAPFPFTTYPTPGLRRLSMPFGGVGQGLYTTIKGDLFAAAGGGLYYVGPNWKPQGKLASLDPSHVVSMTDNADANTMVVVDGTNNGFFVTLDTRVVTQITDSDFYGSDRADFVDGYFVLNRPGNNQFYISNQYSTTFNPLFFAGKTGGGDPVLVAVCLHREIWLLGSDTSEVWGNAGAVDFPYQPVQGVFIQHGLAAIHSVATQDLSIYWLGRNKQGQGIIFRGNGYQAKRISTHAIESKIQSYSTLADARGFTYQQEGHVFYVLTFPSAGATWVWDEATSLWHERYALDKHGHWQLHPIGGLTTAYGEIVVQDIKDGSLYAYDLSYGTDDISYYYDACGGKPGIRRQRSFPHLINDGKRVEYSRFIADMETGTALATFNHLDAVGDAQEGKQVLQNAIPSGGCTPICVSGVIPGQPLISLRFSDNRGKTWSLPIRQTFGATGEENVQILWTRLGMSKDRIFELTWNENILTGLNGAFIEVRPATS